jgi:HK97 family phage portal protein
VNFWDAIKNLVGRDKPYRRDYWPRRGPAGVVVDEDVALKYSAFWGCVRIISETVASLPWCVYKKTTKGRTEDTKSAIYWILHTQPNPEMGAFAFKELLVRRMLVCGNAYAEIERDASGRPIWLWPIASERVRLDRDETGALVYMVKNNESFGNEVPILPRDMFHLKGPGGDGLTGYSVLKMAADAIGTGSAMDRFGASFFGNGANVGAVLTHPKTLSQAAQDRLAASVSKNHAGSNSLHPLILEEGMTFEKMGIPPEEAQFLESRKFQIGDIARWFRVPPHKLGLLDRATWSNIEQQAIEFVTDAIVPTCIRLEQEADLKLYGRNNMGVYYTKFNVAAMMRGDMKSRYDAYAVGRQWGWLSANDILEFEDSNPIKNGDLYLVPVNMTTPELIKNPPKLQQNPQKIAPNDPTMDPNIDPMADPSMPAANKLNGRGKLHA